MPDRDFLGRPTDGVRRTTESHKQMQKSFRIQVGAAVLAVLTLMQCQFLEEVGILNAKEKREQERLIALLVSLGLLQGVGDYVARLYYFNPLLAGSPTNKTYVGEATAADVNPAKKKLILVHGWHADDRDIRFIPYRSIEDLKDRVLTENWSAFVATSEYVTIVGKGYDVFAFDYLTSQGIDENGRRFRAKLDALFSGETGTVYIYAHSMGGLVTRAMLYEGATPSYLAKIITTGTPYHGSPWASGQYLANLSVLGSLAEFVTGTVGGQDLAWDNYDGSISGASNSKLSYLNSLSSRDSLVNVMYGSISGTSAAGDSEGTLLPACAIMTQFGTSDCIVPSGSATLAGHTVASTTDLGDYTHNDVKMGTVGSRNALEGMLP